MEISRPDPPLSLSLFLFSTRCSSGRITELASERAAKLYLVYYPGRCLRRNRESSRKRYLTLDAARIISANLIRESAEEFFTCLLLLLLRCLGVTRGPTITRNRMRIIVNRSPPLRHAVSRITKIKYFAPFLIAKKGEREFDLVQSIFHRDRSITDRRIRFRKIRERMLRL